MEAINSVFPNDSHQKLLLIGLDATDWDLLSEKIAQGKLPQLARLIKKGSSGPLRSLRPLFSPALWATIATGKRPYQHGITGFVAPTKIERGLRTYDSTARSSPAIWDMLSSAHKISHVVGWWNSAPAEKINGIMIDETFRVAQFPAHVPWNVDPTSLSPASLAEELALCRVHPQQLPMSLLQRLIPKLYEIDPTIDWRLSAIAKILAEDLTTLQTTLHLMKHHPWNFSSLYLIGLDSFSHQGTSFREPITCHADQLGIEHYGELIDRSYELYDEWIGELVTAAGEDATIMIVSDHGFYHDDRKPSSLGIHTTAPCDQHAPIGTLIVAGPNIKPENNINHATILDICPTVLACFGLPIGRDMKGQVLSSIFETEPFLSWINSWDQIIPRTPQRDINETPTKATEMALRQLIALGYLPQAPLDHQQIISTAYTDHLFHQALSYLEHDRIDAAIRLLEQAHHDAPERTDILAKLAEGYRSLDLREHASAALKQFAFHRVRDAWQSHQALQTKNYDPQKTLSTIEILEWRHLSSRVQLDSEAVHFARLFAEWLLNPQEPIAKQLCTLAERRSYDFELVMQAADVCFFHDWKERGLGLLKTLADWKKEASEPLTVMAAHHNTFHNAEQAEIFSREALHRDPLDYAAWLELGKSLALQTDWLAAQEAAARATTSVAKRPEAYKLLSQIAEQQKQEDLSERYQKLAQHASQRLSNLKTFLRGTSSRFSQHQLHSISPSITQPIVVTGLPRSGTSLLMQMLTAGGLEAITDYQRLPDAHNPLGYFEHEKIKEISRYPELLESGKVAKVVIPLLWELPQDLNCHVIWIRRPLEEVIISQHRMAGEMASFEELKQAYVSFEIQTSEIIRQRPWNVLQLSHAQVLADPFTAAEKMNQFLGGHLNIKAMAAVVQPSLHRVKKE